MIKKKFFAALVVAWLCIWSFGGVLFGTTFIATYDPIDFSKYTVQTGVTFRIGTNAKTFAPCQNINLRVELHNYTKEDIMIASSYAGIIARAEINITHNNNRPMKLTKYGEMKHQCIPFSFRRSALFRGSESRFPDRLLHRCFDVTLNGTYSVRVKREIVWGTTYAESNLLKITVDDKLIEYPKNFPPAQPSASKHGLSISVVADKLRYEDYGAVYLRILSKNVSDSVLSTIIETKNVLDVYELTLLMPGGNLDFRKPAQKDGSDVEKVDLTLFGKKLVSEKSKTTMPFVQIKPNEEAAESVIVLNRIFDMSTDGIYGLIVTKKIKDQNGNEQTISTEPFPIRIGDRPTEEEREADRLRRRLEGNDPDYPIWQSRDGLFKVIAKLISVDKDIITLEKPDGKRTTFNISDLQPDNQKQIPKIIEEQKRQKELEEFEKQ